MSAKSSRAMSAVWSSRASTMSRWATTWSSTARKRSNAPPENCRLQIFRSVICNLQSAIMSKRTEQVGDEIQRILGEVIQYELKDPRVGFATVVGVAVSGDMQHAKVHIS